MILRSFLALFFGLVVCQAQHPALFGRAVRVSGGAAAATYLINQRFEGTGYDNSEAWFETLGTPNEDYITTVLEGAQSLFLDSSGGTSQRCDSATNALFYSHIWGYMRFRVNAYPSSTSSIFSIRTNGTAFMDAQMDTTGHLRVDIGVNSTLTVLGMSLNTLYHIFWEYQTGTGLNALGSIGFTSDGTIPTGNNLSSSLVGTSTGQYNNIRLNAVATETIIYDQVLIDDVAIGANPP